ncbi:MAG: hypothetical protein AVDCRST_MAG83-2054, partial [uncultured Arthrobacter sp.]
MTTQNVGPEGERMKGYPNANHPKVNPDA